MSFPALHQNTRRGILAVEPAPYLHLALPANHTSLPGSATGAARGQYRGATLLQEPVRPVLLPTNSRELLLSLGVALFPSRRAATCRPATNDQSGPSKIVIDFSFKSPQSYEKFIEVDREVSKAMFEEFERSGQF